MKNVEMKNLATSLGKSTISKFRKMPMENGCPPGMDSPPPPEEFTVGEAVEVIGYGWYQKRTRYILGGLWAADASEMMILGFIGPVLLCDWKLSRTEEAAITSVVFCGMLVGAVFWGWFCDNFGRRKCFIFATAICAGAGVATAFAPSYFMLLVCRAMVGFGTSGGHVCATIMSEMLPMHVRGEAIIGLVVYWALGAIYVSVVAMLVMPAFDISTGWRILVAVSTVPLFAVLAVSGYIPESPRYNLLRGRGDLALATLRECACVNRVALPPGQLVLTKAAAMTRTRTRFGSGSGNDADDAVPRTSHTEMTFYERLKCLFAPNLRDTSQRLLLLWFVSACTYYGVVLLNVQILAAEAAGTRCPADGRAHTAQDSSATASSGGSGSDESDAACEMIDDSQYVDAFWNTFAELPGIFLTMAMVNRIGRRYTISSLFAVSAASFLLMIPCMGFLNSFWVATARALTSGAFQATYLYTPEVYSTALRATAIGICSSFARFGGALSPFVAQVIFEESNTAALVLLATMCAMAARASATLRIETAGRDIDAVEFEMSSFLPTDPTHGRSSEVYGRIEEDKMNDTESDEFDGDEVTIQLSRTESSVRSRSNEHSSLKRENPFHWSP